MAKIIKMGAKTFHKDFQEKQKCTELCNDIPDKNNRIQLVLVIFIQNLPVYILMLHCSCDPLIPSKQVKSEVLIMPFMGMGVKLTVYGKVVTFRPVDCTRICHSSTMVST